MQDVGVAAMGNFMVACAPGTRSPVYSGPRPSPNLNCSYTELLRNIALMPIPPAFIGKKGLQRQTDLLYVLSFVAHRYIEQSCVVSKGILNGQKKLD